MATIPNPTNRLLTRGLGGPACQGMITMGFHLFHVQIGPVPPPNIQVGGGPYPANMGAANQATPSSNPVYYSPTKQDFDIDSRWMMITIKFGEKEWKKHYIITKNRAEVVVSVLKAMKSATVGIRDFKVLIKSLTGKKDK